jgi:hypothetical protein
MATEEREIKFRCTQEELLLLAEMADSTFRRGDPPPSFQDTARKLLCTCTVDEALTFFLAKIMAIRHPDEKPFLTVPLEDVPLFINDTSRTRQVLVKWRLAIGK